MASVADRSINFPATGRYGPELIRPRLSRHRRDFNPACHRVLCEAVLLYRQGFPQWPSQPMYTPVIINVSRENGSGLKMYLHVFPIEHGNIPASGLLGVRSRCRNLELEELTWGMEVEAFVDLNGRHLHPERLTAGTYKSPMKRKENHLNQTSMRTCSMLIFKGVKKKMRNDS